MKISKVLNCYAKSITKGYNITFKFQDNCKDQDIPKHYKTLPALKVMAGQCSLTIATVFVTAEKLP